MTKAIYILGGMGPQASGELYRILIDKAQTKFKAINNDDFPEIIVHSVPVPDFISNKQAENDALKILQKRVKSINTHDHKSFAIACNTAHLLALDLQKQTDVPFISMIDETVDHINECGSTKIGIIASPVTINSGLYQSAIKKYDIDIIEPDKSDFSYIEQAIRAVISGDKLDLHKQRLLEISARLFSQGAQQIVLGCTELPVIIKASPKNKFVSSTSCLADALLNDYYK